MCNNKPEQSRRNKIKSNKGWVVGESRINKTEVSIKCEPVPDPKTIIENQYG